MTARQLKITPKGVRIIRPYATYLRKIIKKLSRRLHELHVTPICDGS